MEENRPIVMTKDGIYARDEGLITKNVEQPGVFSKPVKVDSPEPPTPLKTRGDIEEPDVEIEKVSRFDCVHKPKEKK